MKTIISVLSSWLCATGVIIVASYTIAICGQGTASDQAKAKQEAESITKRGTIQEYKPATRHSSATKKTTTAAVARMVKTPVYVDNPICASFSNSLARMTADLVDMAKKKDVKLDNGFILTNTNGMPFIKFPEEYTKVEIGGVAMGDRLSRGEFSATRAKIDGSNREKIDGVTLSWYKRLDEPEFYCTGVTYSMLPSTRQVDSIQMHGDLCVGTESKADRIIKEITGWMEEDFGAKDLRADLPGGMLAYKKFTIGKGMDVEVKVNWKKQKGDDGTDAYIDISFTASELVDDNQYERQELGAAADKARIDEYDISGVNYYTVRTKVKESDVKRRVVY